MSTKDKIEALKSQIPIEELKRLKFYHPNITNDINEKRLIKCSSIIGITHWLSMDAKEKESFINAMNFKAYQYMRSIDSKLMEPYKEWIGNEYEYTVYQDDKQHNETWAKYKLKYPDITIDNNLKLRILKSAYAP